MADPTSAPAVGDGHLSHEPATRDMPRLPPVIWEKIVIESTPASWVFVSKEFSALARSPYVRATWLANEWPWGICGWELDPEYEDEVLFSSTGIQFDDYDQFPMS